MATSHRTWRYFTIEDQEATADSNEKPVRDSRFRLIITRAAAIFTLPFRYLIPYLSQFLVLLWLVPIAALLGLNFSNTSIGASAWCWHKNCYLNPFDGESVYELAQKFDKQDHNLLGTLQFVAKALEVWFGFIAANLVYTVTLLIASQHHGMPIGFLATFAEFKDFVFLAAPFRWSAPTVFSKQSNAPPFLKSKLILFLAFATFMAIIANLMGPAVAVLVLPTLSWTEQNVTAAQQFSSLGIDRGPQEMIFDPNFSLKCSTEELLDRQYSCTQYPYGSILDSWISFLVAEIQQNYTMASSMPGISQTGISQELGVSFTFNFSQPNEKKNVSKVYKNWVPNRQVLRSLSSDLDQYLLNVAPDYKNDSKGREVEYYNHTGALQTTLKREGPLLGTAVNIFTPTSQSLVNLTKEGEQEKFVRCYDGLFSSDSPDLMEQDYNYTRCVRSGLGWSSNNRDANFNISTSSNLTDTSATVLVYFADRGAYLRPPIGSDQNFTIASSLDNSTSISRNCVFQNSSAASDSDCDWSEVFPVSDYLQSESGSEISETFTGLRRLTDNTTVVEAMYMDQLVIFEFFSFWVKSAYMLDTAAGSNPLYLVQTDGIPDNDNFELAVAHPDWLLAAWSVDEGGTVPFERAASSSISAGLMNSDYYCAANNNGDDCNTDEFYKAVAGIVYSHFQALSMVFYNYTANPTTFDFHNKSRPIFNTANEVREWGFGLDTRTSKLGVVVVLLGCVCALVQFMLITWKPPHQKSLTELLLAALEYQSQKGELTGETGQEEDKAGMILYQMGPDGPKNKGPFRFEPV